MKRSPRKWSIPRRALARGAAATVLLLLASRLAAVSEGVSRSSEEACRPDVFRLCLEAIPDESSIVACLNQKVPQLSPACRQVIDPKPSRKRRGSTGSDDVVKADARLT